VPVWKNHFITQTRIIRQISLPTNDCRSRTESALLDVSTTFSAARMVTGEQGARVFVRGNKSRSSEESQPTRDEFAEGVRCFLVTARQTAEPSDHAVIH